MSFDIDFTPKGPAVIQQRIAELRDRMGIQDPKEFEGIMKEQAKKPMRLQGNIGSGPMDLRGDDEVAPFNPVPPGGKIPSKVEVQAMIARVAREQGINPKLLDSVVFAESDYNPVEVSSANAKGLMQLMPETAAEMGVTNPFDPYENLTGGATYLKQMIARYPGKLDWALAAYNAGPGAVDRAKGIPNYSETKNYVRKIMARMNEH